LGKIRLIWKVPIFIIFILSFLGRALLIHLVTKQHDLRRARFVANVNWFSRLGLYLMSAKIKDINYPNQSTRFLVVSNHLGFVDILILAAQLPAVFVTSNEMKETPFLGLLTEMAGSLYVERRDRSNILKERQTMTEAMHAGFDVVLYPEGASGDGQMVMPFKKTLMMAVAGTGYSILPVVINFTKCNGEEFSDKWRDYICWYGKQSFLGSLIRTLSLKNFEASVEFLTPVKVDHEDQRNEIVPRIREMISEKYTQIPRP
jgi:lyso-ornithine lipid O-acyltransferase